MPSLGRSPPAHGHGRTRRTGRRRRATTVPVRRAPRRHARPASSATPRPAAQIHAASDSDRDAATRRPSPTLARRAGRRARRTTSTSPGLGEYRVAAARTPDGHRSSPACRRPRSTAPSPPDRCGRSLRRRCSASPPRPAPAPSWYAASCGRCARSRRRRTHVAELPLATGEIELAERVPERLTDERTEVGQVGAALNTLLAHVESSLTARHESEQQVRQFVADASHELRTPLTTIAGYTELARRRPDDPATTRTALDKVEEESARMTAMVEDLLLLARLDSGRPLERRHRRPVPAAGRGRLRRPRRRPRPPLAARPARGVDRGHRRRAAAAPGRDQPAHQRPQVHPGRHHDHRLRARRAASPCTTTAPASRRAWPSTPSSGSPAATRRGPAATPAAPASASPSCRRS